MNNKFMKKMTSGILLCTVIAYTTPIFAYTKEESVYCKLDVNGKNYETIVSNHLINSDKDNLINDFSDLLNIKNVNGLETFTQDGNHIIWNANGNDIYYQGETNKNLPIECNVYYELNGEEISAKDLAGKSGNVKIIIKYINKDEHIVNINGKNEKMYTPFVTMCGTIINNEKNRNIKISNGRVIDDGSKTMAFGLAMPGLKESLALSDDKLDIPDTVEITMDSTDFQFGSIYNFVTPKILEETDLSIFDNLDEIYSKVNTLQSSSKQLVSGANTLKNGTKTYLEKSQEFNSAMNQVSNGMSEASNNYSKIDDGISMLNKNSSTLTEGSKKINEGTETLSKALNTMSEKVNEMQSGAKELADGANTLNEKVNGINPNNLPSEAEVKSLQSSIAALETVLQSNINFLNNLSNLKTVTTSVTTENTTRVTNSAIKNSISAANLGLTDDQIEALNQIIDTSVETAVEQAVSQSINSAVDGTLTQMHSKELLAANNTASSSVAGLSGSLDSLSSLKDLEALKSRS